MVIREDFLEEGPPLSPGATVLPSLGAAVPTRCLVCLRPSGSSGVLVPTILGTHPASSVTPMCSGYQTPYLPEAASQRCSCWPWQVMGTFWLSLPWSGPSPGSSMGPALREPQPPGLTHVACTECGLLHFPLHPAPLALFLPTRRPSPGSGGFAGKSGQRKKCPGPRFSGTAPAASALSRLFALDLAPGQVAGDPVSLPAMTTAQPTQVALDSLSPQRGSPISPLISAAFLRNGGQALSGEGSLGVSR